MEKQASSVDSKLPVGERELIIFTLSDSSGETAASVAQAALVQFPPGHASIYRLPQARSCQQIAGLVREIAHGRSLIAYTLVLPEYRETLEEEARRAGVPTIDLLGPLITRVAHLTEAKPLAQPGRLHLLDETYFRRMEAVNFAVRYDDGKNPEGISQADVILVGLSRTSKTPNCMYLAQHYGLKAANVPIVPGVDPPLALFTVPSRKIIGLTIDPHLLHNLRATRAQIIGMPAGSEYADLDEIKSEVQYAKRIFRELKCHHIDVSARAIEETSSEIFLYLRGVQQA
ncbi:MAG TPA: pyruvate, water dikinase regulatory protein [Candidatus Obscuribacterales bacterium]